MSWELFAGKPGWHLVNEGQVLATINWHPERNEYVNPAGAGMGKSWDEAKRKAEQSIAPKRRSA